MLEECGRPLKLRARLESPVPRVRVEGLSVVSEVALGAQPSRWLQSQHVKGEVRVVEQVREQLVASDNPERHPRARIANALNRRQGPAFAKTLEVRVQMRLSMSPKPAAYKVPQRMLPEVAKPVRPKHYQVLRLLDSHPAVLRASTPQTRPKRY